MSDQLNDQDVNADLGRDPGRRSLLKGLGLAGAAFSTETLFASDRKAHASGSRPSQGDVAILRLLAAAELIEADLWLQYAELGGVGTNNAYQAASLIWMATRRSTLPATRSTSRVTRHFSTPVSRRSAPRWSTAIGSGCSTEARQPEQRRQAG